MVWRPIRGIYADRYANGEEEHLLGTQSGDLRWAVHAGIDAEIADRQLNAQTPTPPNSRSMPPPTPPHRSRSADSAPDTRGRRR
ncbi:hypothetical protein [Nocardia sp. CC227C]|uniref:hypothetical protein n=1 Tax=Nocardia sp. CC227C TaxID=3044562 RepID=UPI00278C8CF5|nr:hypothetical protein [Nocardia sp. CC227C]